MADPLSITASVIAVTVLGVKSTKIIYETISGLANVQSEFTQVQGSVAALELILEEICTLANVTKDELIQGNQLAMLNNGQINFFKAIFTPLQSCASEMEEVAEKVQKWQNKYSTRSKVKKWIGSVHHFIKTADIQQIQKMVKKHLAIFGNHMTIAGLKQNKALLSGQESMQATLHQEIVHNNTTMETAATLTRELVSNEFQRSNQRNNRQARQITTGLERMTEEASLGLADQKREIMAKVDHSSRKTQEQFSSKFENFGTQLEQNNEELKLKVNQLSTETTTHFERLDLRAEVDTKQLSSRFEAVGLETTTTMREFGSTSESHRNDMRSDNLRLETKVSENLESLGKSSMQYANTMMLAFQEAQEKMMGLLAQQSGDKIRVLELEEQLRDIAKADTEEGFDNQLQGCIDRLYAFRETSTDTIDTGLAEVQDVLEELLCILKAFLRETILSEPVPYRGNGITMNIPSSQAEKWRLAKRICGGLDSSQPIHIAATSSWQKEIIPHKVARTDQYRAIITTRGTMSLLTTTVISNESIYQPGDGIRDLVETFKGSLIHIPKSNTKKRKRNQLIIRANFAQRLAKNGAFTFSPTISFSSIRPDNAEIFQVVRNGDLMGLRCLLEEKKASLTDCDTSGNNLLWHCFKSIKVSDRIVGWKTVPHGLPETCKFLIDNGADVNHLVETHHSYGQRTLMPLLLHMHQTFLYCELKTINDCIKMILEAGADSSLCEISSSFSLSYLLRTVHKNQQKSEFFRLVLDCGDGILDLEQRDPHNGQTVLLTASDTLARGENSLDNLYKIHLFLDRKASAAVRNNKRQNCLHLLLRIPDFPSPLLVHLFVRLIQAGADVYAKDQYQDTPTSLAQGKRYERSWIKALETCGFSPELVYESAGLRILNLSNDKSSIVELAELIECFAKATWIPKTFYKVLIDAIKMVEDILEQLPDGYPYYGKRLGEYLDKNDMGLAFRAALRECGYADPDKLFGITEI